MNNNNNSNNLLMTEVRGEENDRLRFRRNHRGSTLVERDQKSVAGVELRH